MPTYDLIASYTLPSAANSYTFSSIPATYTDLVLITNWAGDGVAANLYLRFNGDSGNNYYGPMFSGVGSTAAGSVNGAGSQTGTITWTGASFNDTWGGHTIHINEYRNTNIWKNALSTGGSAVGEATFGCGMWASTAAINSIELRSAGPNWKAGSVFTLYGITAA